MPPRFKPFTSFLTQGMNNTNKNINRMNQPSYGQIGGQGGGGNIMGGAQQGGEQYGGDSGPSGMEEWDPTWHTTPGAGLGYPGSWSGGITPPEEEPPRYGLTPLTPGSIEEDWPTTPSEQPHDPLPPGYQWQWVNGNWEPVPIEGYGGGVINPDWQGPTTEPGYETPQEVLDYVKSFSLPDFAGGGGQGGQAAKKLYYPGTSGGFASVGTGIGGGGSTLDELLKSLQG